MRLYLVRHGEALSEVVDPSRPLSEEGKAQTHKIAQFLLKGGFNVDTIFHSTKKRAQETAVILRNALNPACPMTPKDFLGPHDPTDGIFQEIQRRTDDMMIVGHLPFLAKLLSRLVVGDEKPLLADFQPSSVVILKNTDSSIWQMVALISPQYL